jgi:YD repeat-containing protein
MMVTGQATVSYGYEDAHQLTSITQASSVVELAYGAASRRNTLTFPNGVVVNGKERQTSKIAWRTLSPPAAYNNDVSTTPSR